MDSQIENGFPLKPHGSGEIPRVGLGTFTVWGLRVSFIVAISPFWHACIVTLDCIYILFCTFAANQQFRESSPKAAISVEQI